eukprot:8513757-Lingulodinium_polyedra.AAC.1
MFASRRAAICQQQSASRTGMPVNIGRAQSLQPSKTRSARNISRAVARVLDGIHCQETYGKP